MIFNAEKLKISGQGWIVSSFGLIYERGTGVVEYNILNFLGRLSPQSDPASLLRYAFFKLEQLIYEQPLEPLALQHHRPQQGRLPQPLKNPRRATRCRNFESATSS